MWSLAWLHRHRQIRSETWTDRAGKQTMRQIWQTSAAARPVNGHGHPLAEGPKVTAMTAGQHAS